MKTFLKTIAGGVVSTALLFSASCVSADEKPRWPNGAKAAISLTYDDSLMSHFDNAIPALDKHGFKGTFYLMVNTPVFTDHMEDWRKVAKAGHELGNHSMFHPCRGPETTAGRDWVAPERDLDLYTVPRMVQELTLANDLIKSIDGETRRTYAYPCGDGVAGGKSFVEAITPLFIGARGLTGHSSKITDKKISMHAIPTIGGDDKTGTELIAIVDNIMASGGYGTITFHGVGGDYLIAPNKAHEELLAYLAKHKDEIWVDTVRAVISHEQAHQAAKK